MKTQSAPKLKPFGNPITLAILLACILLLGIGLILSTLSPVGIIIGIFGVVIWWAGDTVHPSEPRTAGLVKFWDSYITLGDRNVVVGGRTILAPYWPIFLSSTLVEITNKDKDFSMKLLSRDNIQLEGFISVTLRPDIADLVDFIQASGGDMGKIFEQLDDIIYEQAKSKARENDAEDIAKKSELISGPLRLHLQSNVFEQGSFGVEIVKIQARFDMPQDIINAMQQQVREGYERQGELKEYDTDTIAAQRLQTSYRDAGLTINLKDCLDEIKTLRLIRDERVARIETTGKGGNTVILADAKLDMNKKNHKGKGES